MRVACVPNGIEYRFWPPLKTQAPLRVCPLAEHTAMPIPADGRPLNLSQEQAVELGRFDPEKPSLQCLRRAAGAPQEAA